MTKDMIASLHIDCQKGFTPLCPDELPVPDGHNIVAALNAQDKLARWRVASKDWHQKQAYWIASKEHPQFSRITRSDIILDDLDVYWNSHCIAGTEGAELLPGLPRVRDYDFMVYKGLERDMHPYGACYHDLHDKISTGLIEFLKDRKIETVIVGGLSTEYCVKTTALQLVKHFNVVVNLSACRAIGQPDGAIKDMLQQGIEVDYL